MERVRVMRVRDLGSRMMVGNRYLRDKFMRELVRLRSDCLNDVSES